VKYRGKRLISAAFFFAKKKYIRANSEKKQASKLCAVLLGGCITD
jgi:hypothetical protein